MRRSPGPALWVESGGTGQPLLVMLHGLGANAAAWQRLRPIVEAGWRGRWLAPELRAHGRSGHATPYGMAMHAADVAGLLDPADDIVILGHSKGGRVAMMLACGWFGITVKRVVAFGVKLVWSNEEVAKAQQLARAPVRCFAAHGEAIDLRVSGLKGLIDPSSPGAAIGIVAEEGRFRLAADPSRGGGAGAARLHLCLGRPAGRARPWQNRTPSPEEDVTRLDRPRLIGGRGGFDKHHSWEGAHVA